jgi:hypothetical protein
MSGNAEQTVKMSNEWPLNLPVGWDRNFNNTEFEIVDNTNLPVLQIRYIAADSIEVSGIFVAPNGSVTIAFGDETTSCTPNARVPHVPERKAWFKYPSQDHLGELDQ